jgi:hypothetical protein
MSSSVQEQPGDLSTVPTITFQLPVSMQAPGECLFQVERQFRFFCPGSGRFGESGNLE